MRSFLILIATIASLVSTSVLAQEQPPIPRPRPDRGEQLALQPPAPEQNEALNALQSALQQSIGNATPDVPAGPPQAVTLSAKILEEGAIIPNGLVWRIFDTQADDSGQLALLAKSDDSVAVFSLTPGNYVVHVAYGRSQTTDTLTVGQGNSSKILVLDSGALRLNAAITGDIAVPIEQLSFQVFATESENFDRVLVADNVTPGTMLHLNAGVYNVVSKFGDINAEVRADLRVEPGQITDATLYHRASEVNFRLVSEEGGEAIADVDWTLKSIDGLTLYSGFGAFPSAILTEGDYTIFAKRGANAYNRDFSVHGGPPIEIEVLTTIYEGT